MMHNQGPQLQDNEAKIENKLINRISLTMLHHIWFTVG